MTTDAPAITPRRLRPARALFNLAAAILVVYVAAAVWLMTQETRLVFRAGSTLGSTRPAPPMTQVEIQRQDGLRQFGWEVRRASDGAAAPWVLFLHGNAGSIGSRVNIARYEQLRSLGLNVMAPEYRGFGGLDGVPSEPAVYADARAGYEHLRQKLGVPPERIAIYGWSLGAAVAVDLAAQVPEAAVILEGAPASLVAIGQSQYPFFPIRLLMRNPFHAVDKVDRIKAPMLFLHSPDDRVIPISEGRRLFDAARTTKKFVEVRGGHVNAAEADADTFLASIGALLNDARLVLSPPQTAELAR
jgi:dipeptidyl aminopeptidase/acylaminoacyl peptidase